MKKIEVFHKLATIKPIYAMVLLDEQSRHTLEQWWRDNVSELLPKAHCHHMTIQFKPTEEEWQNLLSSNIQPELKVIGYAKDEKAQAVFLSTNIESTSNAFPHITVATDGITTPKYSNELLANGIEPISGPVLTGTIEGFFGGKQ